MVIDNEVATGLFVGMDPATGIVAGVGDDGLSKPVLGWNPVQGDTYHWAPAGSVGGGGTRRHLFDREVYVLISTGPDVYANVRAWGSITGAPTTVQGFGITNAIRNDQNGTIAGTLGVTSIAVSGGGTGQGKLFFDASEGLVLQAKTGSTADFALYTPGAGWIMRVLTGSAAIRFGGSLIPITDASVDFGTSSFRWRHAFMSGDLAIGGEINISGGVGRAGIKSDGANLILKDASNNTIGTLNSASFIINSSYVLLGGASYQTSQLNVNGSASSAQATFYGGSTLGATPSNKSGAIRLGTFGAYSGYVQFDYDNSTNPTLYLDNTFNDPAGRIILRLRTLGTPINALTLSGTAASLGLPVDLPTSQWLSFGSGNVLFSTGGAGTVLQSSSTLSLRIAFVGDPIVVSGTAVSISVSLLPASDNAIDFGSGSFRWRDLTIARNAAIGGALSSTSLSVTGASAGAVVATLTSFDTGTTTDLLVYQRSGGLVRGVLRFNNANKFQFGTTTTHVLDILADNNVIGTFSNANGLVMNAYPIAGVTILTVTTAGHFGTSPATAGAVRIGNQQRIMARNVGNSANINIGYIDGSDNLIFGPGDAITITTAAIRPTTDAASDFGSGSFRWRDGYFSRDLVVGGTLTVSGTFSFSSITLSGTAKSEGFYEDFNTVNVAASAWSTIKTPTLPGEYEVAVDEASGVGVGKWAWAKFIYDGNGNLARMTAANGGYFDTRVNGGDIQISYLGGFGGTANMRWRISRLGGPSY